MRSDNENEPGVRGARERRETLMSGDSSKPIKNFGKIGEQVLSGIVQSIEAAVVLHDRSLKVVFVNESFKKIYEKEDHEVIGKSPVEFLPDFEREQKEAILRRLRRTLTTGEKSRYHEFTYCSPSGKFRYLLGISIPIFNGRKEITHVMSVIHDLTRRKELEQAAVKAAQLSSIADMAYILAHEINNPLTGIILGLSTLYDNLTQDDNIRTVDSIMKDLKRIQSIVSDFLRPKRKGLNRRPERLPVVAEIIDDILLNLSGQLNHQRIKVVRRLCSDDCGLELDRDEMHRALMNIMLNAVQVLPRDGRIIIRSRVLPGEGPADPARLLLSLTDNGPGIEAQKQDMIFNPFYSSKSGGTGLGLSICRNIVTAHGGTMEVQSADGRGTTINIFLPTQDKRTEACS